MRGKRPLLPSLGRYLFRRYASVVSRPGFRALGCEIDDPCMIGAIAPDALLCNLARGGLRTRMLGTGNANTV